MRTPPLVVTYRSVTAAFTALILASVILGFAGYGPLVVLHQVAHPLLHALHLDRISG
jgi:cobalt transporter subunit CbtB